MSFPLFVSCSVCIQEMDRSALVREDGATPAGFGTHEDVSLLVCHSNDSYKKHNHQKKRKRQQRRKNNNNNHLSRLKKIKPNNCL